MFYTEYQYADGAQPDPATYRIEAQGLLMTNAKKNWINLLRPEREKPSASIIPGQPASHDPLSGIAPVKGSLNGITINDNPTFPGSGNQNHIGVEANDILQAIAVQKLKMKRATYGTRYVDILKSFGVKVNYQMLQRPEILQRHRTKIAVNDVVSTAQRADNADASGLGDMTGYGINGTNFRIKRKAFPEHGTLLGFTVIRPAYMSTNQVNYLDRAASYEGFYDPALELLPNFEIYQKDILNHFNTGDSSLLF